MGLKITVTTALLRCVILILVMSQGAVLAVPVFPIKPSRNGRYLVDQQNKPFFSMPTPPGR
ncbi:MAG: hypothetical protein WKF84_02785 [Pyrinomonadaceae bacterium]